MSCYSLRGARVLDENPAQCEFSSVASAVGSILTSSVFSNVVLEAPHHVIGNVAGSDSACSTRESQRLARLAPHREQLPCVHRGRNRCQFSVMYIEDEMGFARLVDG